MQMMLGDRLSRGLWLSLSVVVAACLQTPGAEAQTNTKQIKEPVTATACKREPGKPYFIEFRARTAASYGHSFVFFGRLGAPGRFGKFEVAGLHPEGDDPAVYLQGMAVPVPAETGVSDGDLDEQYLTARYCIVLSEAEFRKVAAFIKNLQATTKEWHAPTRNCNWFLGEIATSMGLLTPPTGFWYPDFYVGMLEKLNGGKGTLAAATGTSAQ